MAVVPHRPVIIAKVDVIAVLEHVSPLVFIFESFKLCSFLLPFSFVLNELLVQRVIRDASPHVACASVHWLQHLREYLPELASERLAYDKVLLHHVVLQDVRQPDKRHHVVIMAVFPFNRSIYRTLAFSVFLHEHAHLVYKRFVIYREPEALRASHLSAPLASALFHRHMREDARFAFLVVDDDVRVAICYLKRVDCPSRHSIPLSC